MLNPILFHLASATQMKKLARIQVLYAMQPIAPLIAHTMIWVPLVWFVYLIFMSHWFHLEPPIDEMSPDEDDRRALHFLKEKEDMLCKSHRKENVNHCESKLWF